MDIDFHTHGKLAKKLPFSGVYTDWLLKEAKNAGLDAICLTEHFNTLQFERLYEYIQSRCQRDQDTLITRDGLRIFAGMETDIAETGHILCLGNPEEILELNRRLEPYKEKGKFLDFSSLMKLFREYSVLVGAAHPFREGGKIPSLPVSELKKLDFIDLNGKDVAIDSKGTQEKTYALGKVLGIPVVSGSDTHQAVQYGCIRTRMNRDVNQISSLYEEMKAGNYTIAISENASFQVKTAGLLKKALKEIYANGGDYISVLVQK